MAGYEAAVAAVVGASDKEPRVGDHTWRRDMVTSPPFCAGVGANVSIAGLRDAMCCVGMSEGDVKGDEDAEEICE